MLETYDQVFFPIFSVEFLIFFNFFFFSECETQSQRDHYCFNGGTCFRVPDLDSGPHCQCPKEFTGKRCELRDIDLQLDVNKMYSATENTGQPNAVSA